jgi:hypothetical protein
VPPVAAPQPQQQQQQQQQQQEPRALIGCYLLNSLNGEARVKTYIGCVIVSESGGGGVFDCNKSNASFQTS